MLLVLANATTDGDHVEELPGYAHFGPPDLTFEQTAADFLGEAYILMSTPRRRGFKVAPTASFGQFLFVKQHKSWSLTKEVINGVSRHANGFAEAKNGSADVACG